MIRGCLAQYFYNGRIQWLAYIAAEFGVYTKRASTYSFKSVGWARAKKMSRQNTYDKKKQKN